MRRSALSCVSLLRFLAGEVALTVSLDAGRLARAIPLIQTRIATPVNLADTGVKFYRYASGERALPQPANGFCPMQCSCGFRPRAP